MKLMLLTSRGIRCENLLFESHYGEGGTAMRSVILRLFPVCVLLFTAAFALCLHPVPEG